MFRGPPAVQASPHLILSIKKGRAALFLISARDSKVNKARNSGGEMANPRARIVMIFGSNFETLEHDWLVNIWPAELRFKNALGIDDPDSDVEPWAAIPRTFTGLLNWAFVVRNPSPQDMMWSLFLLYKTPRGYPGAPSNMLYPMSVRMQEYVEKCNLRGLGNWDGYFSMIS
ncbi:hypothetical protein B0H11DRAFT_2233381 [Mycena galericulata]|nr:hypothetical protein B0H11DRAFT_2233381 [Mycena galericulata]